MAVLVGKAHLTETVTAGSLSSPIGPLGAPKRHAVYSAGVHSTQAGKLAIEATYDGTTWVEVDNVDSKAAVTSGNVAYWRGGFVGQSMRARFKNTAGASATVTAFALGE